VDRVVPIEALRLKARHGGNDTGQVMAIWFSTAV